MSISSNKSQLTQGNRVGNRRVPLLGMQFAVAALALGGMSSAFATPPAALEDAADGQVASGTELAALSGSGAAAAHYTHQPQLVTGSCMQLETEHRALAEAIPVIVNHCDYPVTVSYCVNDSDADTHGCQAINRRKFDSQILQPGASIKVDADMTQAAAGGIDWIACRGNTQVFSTLYRSGNATRGECLGPERDTGAAVRTATAPVSGPR